MQKPFFPSEKVEISNEIYERLDAVAAALGCTIEDVMAEALTLRWLSLINQKN